MAPKPAAKSGAHNQKENAKPNVGLPKKFPVNAGTASAVTPPNLGVPTPLQPFDAKAAMQDGPGSIGAGDGTATSFPGSPDAMAGLPATRTPFQHPLEMIQQVLGIIHNWPAEDLEALKEHIDQVLALEEENPDEQKPPGESDNEPPAGAPPALAPATP